MTDPACDHSQGIYQLAERCEVGITAACRRARIAPCTPSRWKAGTRPRPVQLRRLRRAIVEMARAAGTLPPGVAEEVLATPSAEDEVRAGLLTIELLARALQDKLDPAA